MKHGCIHYPKLDIVCPLDKAPEMRQSPAGPCRSQVPSKKAQWNSHEVCGTCGWLWVEHNPVFSAEHLAKFDGCVACAHLNGLTQCNTCRAEKPNAQTLTRRELMRLVREEGMSPTEAEAFLGTGPGPVVGG